MQIFSPSNPKDEHLILGYRIFSNAIFIFTKYNVHIRQKRITMNDYIVMICQDKQSYIVFDCFALYNAAFLLPLQQCNDVGLMAYLGTITKTCNSMNQFINKFNVLYDRQGIGRRMRGLFF